MTVRNLHRLDAQRKCDLSGDPHSAKRPYAKAMQACTWTRSGRIADRLGLSQRTVETYGNPADPQRGPNQALAIIMHEALSAGASPDEALAPLFALCEEFGGEFAPRLPVIHTKDLLAQADRLAANTLRSLGEAVSRLFERLNGGLSPAERVATLADLRANLRDTYELIDLVAAEEIENASRG